MLKLLRHLLCLGLLFGLAGNSVAVAAPCMLMSQGQPAATAAMPDCQMAHCADCDANTKTSGKSGTDKSSGCMAMAACAAVLGLKQPEPAATPRLRAATVGFWPASTKLAGRDVAPEPEPPTLLG
ncbi:MAG: hypothetical protein WC729_14490 [Sphingomonas sp.]|uniref:hypothetical protein n=1 Tax=Sphingomonas sp. TaxID=28214 RepID=UPI003568D8B6